MSKFKVSSIVAYPKEEVFTSFIALAKDEFNKFNVENPLGAKSRRIARKTKQGNIFIETVVVDYIKNEVYETKSQMLSSTYNGRYEFKDIGDNCTEITLIESQNLFGIINKIGFVFQSITAKKKIQKKLDNTVTGIEEKIEKERAKKERMKK